VGPCPVFACRGGRSPEQDLHEGLRREFLLPNPNGWDTASADHSAHAKSTLPPLQASLSQPKLSSAEKAQSVTPFACKRVFRTHLGQETVFLVPESERSENRFSIGIGPGPAAGFCFSSSRLTLNTICCRPTRRHCLLACKSTCPHIYPLHPFFFLQHPNTSDKKS
jgi:hypothetical protein